MIYFTILVILLGLTLGSFANCLIWRLYKEEGIGGRSYCPLCGHAINWYDNIPFLSYLILRGRCRHCRAHISWHYPLVEVVTAILFLVFWLQQFNFSFVNNEFLLTSIFSPSFFLRLIYLFLVTWTLIIIFVFDARYYLVSTILVWPATIVFFLLNIFMGASWLSLVTGMAGAAIFFLLQYILTKGKGLGEGDIWLGILLGAIFANPVSLVFAIFSAYILGSITGLFLIVLNRKVWSSKLPLGVFLALGAIITLILETNILNWYHLFF